MEKIRIGVIGATSLTAQVLLQLLVRHHHVEITYPYVGKQARRESGSLLQVSQGKIFRCL